MSNLILKKTSVNDHGNHICALDSEQARVFETETGYATFKNITKISKFNPITKFYFRSLTAIEKERMRHEKSKNFKCIIHPLSLFRFYWECGYLFILYIGLIVIPINFINGPIGDNGQLSFGFNLAWECIGMVLDILYLTDVIMTLFTGYCVFNKKVIHLEFKSIIGAYISSIEFYLDLICCFTELIFMKIYILIFPQIFFVKYISLIPAIQIWRLKRFLRYLNNVSEKISHFYYSRITIRYFSLIILFLHWLTCVYERLLQDKLMYSPRDDYIIYSYGHLMPLIHSYFSLYIHCQHMVISCLLSIASYSNGSIITDANTLSEFIEFLIFSLMGFIFNTIMMILLLQMIMSLNASEAKYHSIMSQLLKYMSYKMLPHGMRDRIVCYYDYRFQKKYFRETSIISILSVSLGREINLYSCRSLIESVSILRDLPPDVISDVVSHLQHQVFLYNDIIVKAGLNGDCMYFIANGTVAVSTPTGREICHLQDGAYFGEIALICNDQRRIANVIAIEICEVYRLDRIHFRKCFDPNSTIFKKVEQVAQERMEKTILLEQLHKKYLMEHNMKRSFSRRRTIDAEMSFY